MGMEERPIGRISNEIRLLFQAALAIFLVAVAIGMLNGMDLVDFNRPTLLSHVHAGALGWITLGIFAACLWFFSKDASDTGWLATWPRWMAWGAVVTTAIYVVTFYYTTGVGRPTAGTLMLLFIIAFYGWTIAQARERVLTVSHWALLAAMTNLVIGAVFGVLLGLQMAGRMAGLPQGLFIAHPSALVIGYLLLAGMALGEWYLMPPEAASRLGLIQVALPFLGGLTLIVGALLDIFILLILNVPFEVVGVIIFLWRIRAQLKKIQWLQSGPGRLFGISVLFIAVNIGLLAYLIVTYAEDFESTPPWLFFALDHSIFIGVMSNALFGLIHTGSQENQSMWPWADHVLFWGMNLGLIGFVIGLIQQSATIKQIFSPIMGASILVAMLSFTFRLQKRAKGSVAR